MPTQTAAGYYGKIPLHGDFVQLRLPQAFIQPWDDWLQAGLASSRERLADGWLDVYLTSPAWRFALAPGVCGEPGYAGVMIPSVDRVGRYFPFIVSAPLLHGVSVFAAARAAEWFVRAEELILTALDDEFDRSRFDAALEDLGDCGEAAQVAPASPSPPQSLESANDLDRPLLTLAEQMAAMATPDCTLWWSHGSDRVAPSLLWAHGLPRTGGFHALLTGNWDDWP